MESQSIPDTDKIAVDANNTEINSETAKPSRKRSAPLDTSINKVDI